MPSLAPACPSLIDISTRYPQPFRKRIIGEIDTQMIHRIGGIRPDGTAWPTNVYELIEELLPHWPNEQIPYAYIVDATGQSVYKTSQLNLIGQHGWKWNVQSLGIACVGDFRVGSEWKTEKHNILPLPNHNQLCTLIQLLTYVCITNNLPVHVVGHTDVPDATRIRNHSCPGDYFPVKAIHKEVNNAVENYRNHIEKSNTKRG